MNARICCPKCGCINASIVDILDYSFNEIVYKVCCENCDEKFEVFGAVDIIKSRATNNSNNYY